MEENILNIEDARQKRVFQRLMQTFAEQYQQGSVIIQEYAVKMLKEPVSAIEEVTQYLNRVRQISPDYAFVESIAGGPNHDLTTPILNLIGAVYPDLEREHRQLALRKCMNYLDGLKYTYSQNHVALIHEPWLVRDIIVTRSLYFAGCDEYMAIADAHKDWKTFSEKTARPKSYFWLSLLVTHPEYTSLEIRHSFYKQYDVLVNDTNKL